MDIILKIRAFIVTADCGNFSEAARKLNASPSVIMKRVNELEFDFKTTFFERSTRGLTLTDTGKRYLVHARQLMRSYNDLASGATVTPDSIEGPIRIKVPAMTLRECLGRALTDFRAENPLVQLDVVASDRGGNPTSDGFDIAIGMDTLSYPEVVERNVGHFPRLLCASPAYLARCGAPQHPGDLINHPCLTFSVAGPIWTFISTEGYTEVDVRPVLTTNDPEFLCKAACEGQGIVQLALPSVAEALKAGRLMPVLEHFPLAKRWLKIMAPTARLDLARVKLLFDKIVGLSTELHARISDEYGEKAIASIGREPFAFKPAQVTHRLPRFEACAMAEGVGLCSL